MNRRTAHPNAAIDHDEGPHILTPAEIIAPGCGSPDLLTSSPYHRMASPADLAPQVKRPGAHDGLSKPSRIGNRLHHRNGTVTDLAGNPIKKTTGATE